MNDDQLVQVKMIYFNRRRRRISEKVVKITHLEAKHLSKKKASLLVGKTSTQPTIRWEIME